MNYVDDNSSSSDDDQQSYQMNSSSNYVNLSQFSSPSNNQFQHRQISSFQSLYSDSTTPNNNECYSYGGMKKLRKQKVSKIADSLLNKQTSEMIFDYFSPLEASY